MNLGLTATIRRTRLLFFAIFLSSILVRGLVLWRWHDQVYGLGMSAVSITAGRSLATGHGLTVPLPFTRDFHQQSLDVGRMLEFSAVRSTEVQTYHPWTGDVPGYAYFLGAIFSLLGTRLLTAQVFQVLLESMVGTVFVMALLRQRSRAAVLLAGMAFAVALSEAHLSFRLVKDALTGVTLMLAVLAAYACAAPRRWWLGAAALAIVTVAGAYLRPTELALPVFLGATLVWTSDWRRAVTVTSIALAVALVALVPRGMEMQQATGHLTLTRSALWQTVWEGFGEYPNPFRAQLNDEFTFHQAQAEGFTGQYATMEYEAFMRQKVLTAVRAHPLWVAGLWLRRLPAALFGVLPDYGSNGEYLGFHLNLEDLRGIFQAALGLEQTVLVALGLRGLWLERRRWRLWLPVLGGIAYVVMVHALIHVEQRYVGPAVALWTPFIGIALATPFRSQQQESSNRGLNVNVKS